MNRNTNSYQMRMVTTGATSTRSAQLENTAMIGSILVTDGGSPSATKILCRFPLLAIFVSRIAMRSLFAFKGPLAALIRFRLPHVH